jgi:hypothetical protein
MLPTRAEEVDAVAVLGLEQKTFDGAEPVAVVVRACLRLVQAQDAGVGRQTLRGHIRTARRNLALGRRRLAPGRARKEIMVRTADERLLEIRTVSAWPAGNAGPTHACA